MCWHRVGLVLRIEDLASVVALRVYCYTDWLRSCPGGVREGAEGDDDLHKRSMGSQAEVSRYPKSEVMQCDELEVCTR